MIILLPPSEGKQSPSRGALLDPQRLSFPALNPARAQVAEALMALCAGPDAAALASLGLSAGMSEWLQRNRDLAAAPTAPASRIYNGVLYERLDLPSLQGTALRRANRRIVIMSALFGCLRPPDRIPSYRLSADSTLPGVGRANTFWKRQVTEVLDEHTASQLVVDMRSTAYAAMWSPPTTVGPAPTPSPSHRPGGRQYLFVKVWRRNAQGGRTAVSHHNKSLKGTLARFLATTSFSPSRSSDVFELTRSAGWDVELDTTGTHLGLDVYGEPRAASHPV